MASFQTYEAPLDDDLRLIADQERRLIIQYFIQESATQASLDDLIEHVVAHTDSDVTRETIELTLHHKNLPKLANHGLVEYDPRNGDIRYHSRDRIDRLVELISSD